MPVETRSMARSNRTGSRTGAQAARGRGHTATSAFDDANVDPESTVNIGPDAFQTIARNLMQSAGRPVPGTIVAQTSNPISEFASVTQNEPVRPLMDFVPVTDITMEQVNDDWAVVTVPSSPLPTLVTPAVGTSTLTPQRVVGTGPTPMNVDVIAVNQNAGDANSSNHESDVRTEDVAEVQNTPTGANQVSLAPEVPGLPPLRTILPRNNSSITDLTNSGLLEELKIVDPTVWARAGPIRVITDFTSRDVDVYTQVMFALCGRYYMSLPAVGHDPQTLIFLHYCRAASTGNVTGAEEYAAITTRYADAAGEGLESLFIVLSHILVPEAGSSSGTFANLLSPTEFESLLNSLKITNPEILVTYYMCAHFVRGGLPCISPIHTLLSYDVTLAQFLQGACRGNQPIKALSIRISSRLPTLETARFSTQLPVANLDSPVDNPIARPAAVVRPSTGIRIGIGETPVVAARPENQLISQGAVTTNPIPRDSTEFRSSVDIVESALTRLAAVEAENQALRREVTRLAADLRTLEGRLTSMDQIFALNIQRTSHQDLQDRAVIARTLAPPESAEALNLIRAQPVSQPFPSAEQESVIEALSNYRQGQDVQALVNRVKTMLSNAGENVMASNVVAGTITSDFARNRLISTLRGHSNRG